ncbi:MAG: histidinol dehydrogenase [Spirochaetales bacterium]|nr:histidinol dehydrogenase [Spirochaetales bacterium]
MACLQRFDDPKGKELDLFCTRNPIDSSSVAPQVAKILAAVEAEGDAALYAYSKRFDGVVLSSLAVSLEEFEEAREAVGPELKEAIHLAKTNIRAFHEAQRSSGEEVEVMEGVTLKRKVVPIRRVGLYIPGGTAPLFSTVLMLALPAKIAGCREIVLCTPPNREGKVHPAILYAAELCSVDAVYKVGGAQAIGALAYGTETIGRVDKIFGPGNRFVTEAKTQVAQGTCAIDMPAGPSEVMVVATTRSNSAFVASDLLSQAEHGPDSQAMVVLIGSDPDRWIEELEEQLERQCSVLKRSGYVKQSLEASRIAVVQEVEEAAFIANAYAAEHLIINTGDRVLDDSLVDLIESAGSIFVGPYSPESAGDYASGTNHTLPTGGWARSMSGVSTDSFVKKITIQELTKDGLKRLASSVMTMAAHEELEAHGNAVGMRLEGE